ncbi:hypothetical protein KQH51_03545 [bacterium]|nr:hypothetical protein [bacterium]MCB2201996.1 hypothetical protein [bacterium]
MQAVRAGVLNFRVQLSLWPTLYALKLALALLFTIPVWLTVGYELEHSVGGALLAERWSLDVLTELAASRTGSAVAFMLVLVGWAFAAFLVRQFLNGGIYGRLLGLEKARGRAFFAACGECFTGHLMVSFVMLPAYLILFFMGQALSTLIPADLFGRFGLDYLTGRGLRLVLVVAFVLIGVVISEALRLRVSVVPREPLRQLIAGALDFLRANGVRMYGWYVLYFVPFVILWALVEKLALVSVAAVPGLIGIVIEALLFQACSFVRTGQSLLFTATTAPMFRQANPALFKPVQMEMPLD